MRNTAYALVGFLLLAAVVFLGVSCTLTPHEVNVNHHFGPHEIDVNVKRAGKQRTPRPIEKERARSSEVTR